MAGLWDRIVGWFSRGDVGKAEQAALSEDPIERERLTEDYEGYRDDVAAGRGRIDVYEEFQGDERAPRDPY